MAAIRRKNKPQQILHEDRGFWSKTKTRYLNKNGTSWGSVSVNDVYFFFFFCLPASNRQIRGVRRRSTILTDNHYVEICRTHLLENVNGCYTSISHTLILTYNIQHTTFYSLSMQHPDVEETP